MSNITKIFGAATSSNNGNSGEPMPKNAKPSGVPQTASLKTVRKWEKELEIELGKEHNDDGIVNKIWCVVCKEFGSAWRLTSYESKLELVHGYYDVMSGSAM